MSTDPSARRSQQSDLRDMPERGPHQPGPKAEFHPAEPVAEAPRPTEEVAVGPVGRKRRRVGSRTPAPLTAQQAYALS